MNLLPAVFSRTTIVLAVLGFAINGNADAQQPRSSDGSTQQVRQSSPSGNTSINRELQRLFNESGQQMPSMRTADLPYATTPQMQRVRRIEDKPVAAPKKEKKKGLLSRFFRRFRRDEPESQTDDVAPEPPAIVVNENRSMVRRQPFVSTQSHMSTNRRDQQAARASGRPASIILPASQPGILSAPRSDVPRMNLDSREGFVSPFEDAHSFQDDEFSLDLDAIGDGSESTKELDAILLNTQDDTAKQEETVFAEPEPNPFSGLRLIPDDEFVNPFDESAPDLSEAEESGFASYTSQSNPFAEQQSESVDKLPASNPINQWRAGSTPDEVRVDEAPKQERKFGESITSTQIVPQAPRQQTRREKIAARRPLSGFMGFCPVELREVRDLVDASDVHESRFGLHTYRFSSAEARDRFEANPTRYAPAAGGADVVALVNSGEQHSGSLEFAMWYRDRLYLFGSRETMDLFREAPATYADQY